MKLSSKDIRTSLVLIALIFAIFGAMHLVPQPQPASANISPQLREEVTRALSPLSTFDLRQKLTLNDGKRTFLMFYTSWCPHCRTAIPNILNWKSQGALNDYQLIMLSIDEDPEPLIAYLGSQNYHTKYTPYLFRADRQNTMPTLLSEYKMSFRGGIPYAAIIAPNGTLLAESMGTGSWNDITKVIQGERY